jgi:hypothetical protein
MLPIIHAYNVGISQLWLYARLRSEDATLVICATLVVCPTPIERPDFSWKMRL